MPIESPAHHGIRLVVVDVAENQHFEILLINMGVKNMDSESKAVEFSIEYCDWSIV